VAVEVRRSLHGPLNSLPKFVASRTSHEPLAWNATLLKGDVAEEVRKLKQQVGKSILIYGSSELVNTLMQHRLIDVYRVMLYPLTLGTGRRFFRDGGDKIMLTLTSTNSICTTGYMLDTALPSSPRSGGTSPSRRRTRGTHSRP
jgi:dihydrofolate reductase